MITLSLSDFTLELKEGVVKHVGPANKTASAKLYDVDAAEAREFGDDRVKLVFEDEAGSVVHVALPPQTARDLASDVNQLAAESEELE
jgi:hypothetical protein